MFNFTSDLSKRLREPKRQLAVNVLIGGILHIIKQTVNTYGSLNYNSFFFKLMQIRSYLRDDLAST